MEPIDNPTPAPSPVDLHARISESLARTAVCARSVGQYGRTHPLIQELAADAHQVLSELLAVQPTVVLAAADSYFAADSFPLQDESGALSAFAQALQARNGGELKLTAGVTVGEVIDFAEALSYSPEELALRGGLETELDRRGVTHIIVRPSRMPTESREGRDAADIYEEALLLVEEAMRAVQNGLDIPVPEIRAVVADSLRSLMHDSSALLALAGIRSYDRYLSEHSVNVCILSMVLGRDLGLDAASAVELGISAMLHDVGKVFVPEDVVKKPGRLSEEEWQQIRRHPAEGARAIAGLADLPALATTIALEHHVRADGTGYPALPAQYRPHLLSRLVAIVDTYDALTTDRPYRERWTPQQAIAWMLYEAQGQYDRQLMARFAGRARLYPVGSLVRLKSGDYAVVVGGNHSQPHRPVLRLVVGPGLREGTEAVVDLSSNTDPSLEIDVMAQPVEVLLPYADRILAA